ncbi:hypothetical protein FB451DRAFT_1339444 [Mycena latifolia]|nr:hypothetical protein FB451DRAFT_1339444 [Mycena latifolia]
MHLVLLLLSALVLSVHSAPSTAEFYDPRNQGGSMLDNAGAGGGEPLNVIISGHSTPVLTNAGFLGFAGAIGFATECFGLHLGDPQSANLGNGNGWVNQTMELRQDFGSAPLGTCWESLTNGNSANSGALFSRMVSTEEDVTQHHTISPDGYNRYCSRYVRRNLLAQHASETTTYNGVKDTTTTRRIAGLINPGSEGLTCSTGIATDGVVVLLTVTAL